MDIIGISVRNNEVLHFIICYYGFTVLKGFFIYRVLIWGRGFEIYLKFDGRYIVDSVNTG